MALTNSVYWPLQTNIVVTLFLCVYRLALLRSWRPVILQLDLVATMKRWILCTHCRNGLIWQHFSQHGESVSEYQLIPRVSSLALLISSCILSHHVLCMSVGSFHNRIDDLSICCFNHSQVTCCTRVLEQYFPIMEQLATAAEKSYRDLTDHTEGFYDYFYQATVVNEIGLINIGSRPARRNATIRDKTSLRAIPWVFGWAQVNSFKTLYVSCTLFFEFLLTAFAEWSCLYTGHTCFW